MEKFDQEKVSEILEAVIKKSGKQAFKNLCSLDRTRDGGFVLLGKGGQAFVFKGTGRDGKNYAVRVSASSGFEENRKGMAGQSALIDMLFLLCPYVTETYAVKFYKVKDEGGRCAAEALRKESLESERFAAGDILVKIEVMPEYDCIVRRVGRKLNYVRAELDGNELEVLKLGIQMAKALSYFEDLGITHRDIKPSNIFWDGDRGIYKLGDLGASAEDGAKDVAHTRWYSAPEREKGVCTVRSDIYSLGKTLYVLLNELHLPNDFVEISKCKWAKYASPRTDMAIRKMCAEDPEERYGSFSEVFGALAAAYFECAAGQYGKEETAEESTYTYGYDRYAAVRCEVSGAALGGAASLGGYRDCRSLIRTAAAYHDLSGAMQEVLSGHEDLRHTIDIRCTGDQVFEEAVKKCAQQSGEEPFPVNNFFHVAGETIEAKGKDGEGWNTISYYRAWARGGMREDEN